MPRLRISKDRCGLFSGERCTFLLLRLGEFALRQDQLKGCPRVGRQIPARGSLADQPLQDADVEGEGFGANTGHVRRLGSGNHIHERFRADRSGRVRRKVGIHRREFTQMGNGQVGQRQITVQADKPVHDPPLILHGRLPNSRAGSQIVHQFPQAERPGVFDPFHAQRHQRLGLGCHDLIERGKFGLVCSLGHDTLCNGRLFTDQGALGQARRGFYERPSDGGLGVAGLQGGQAARLIEYSALFGRQGINRSAQGLGCQIGSSQVIESDHMTANGPLRRPRIGGLEASADMRLAGREVPRNRCWDA